MNFQCNMYKEFNNPEPVQLNDGHAVSAIGTGKVKMISKLFHGHKTTV